MPEMRELLVWKWPRDLHRHESVCDADVNREYKGGVYRPPPSIFQRLDDEGIVINEALRYYPYRATFDIECCFDKSNLPPDRNTLQWVARHIPLSVSVASNVPGYEPALCFITDGDAHKLVESMMAHLITLSDAAYDYLLTAYKDVLDNLKEQASVWDEVAATAHDDDENGKKTVNPYKLQLRQVPESIRLRTGERSFPVRIHGRPAEVRRSRSTSTRSVLQSTQERRHIRRGLRSLPGGVAR